MAIAKVMQMVKDNECKFVDFRFTDTKGKEHHVSVPIKAFDETKFTEGHAFDIFTIIAQIFMLFTPKLISKSFKVIEEIGRAHV